VKSYYRPDYDAHQAPYHRARRRRLLFTALGRGAAIGAVVALLGVGAAAWNALGPGWVRARLASLRLFTLESVAVSGNKTLGRADVVGAAGLRVGESLIGLDLEGVRAKLASHPWVREASVRRRLPGTIVVEIVERVPCAVVRGDRDLLVDDEGAVLASSAAGSRGDLPVLTGVETAGDTLTARGAADVAAGLELVAAIRQVGFPAIAAVAAIDLADPDDALIVPVSGRPVVHAGRRDAAGRLGRWRLVAPDMAARWPELEYVDLRAEGQVVAMPAAPAAPEKGGKNAAGPDAGAAPAGPSPARPRPAAATKPARAAAGGGHA
jgi:cell division protein FtsQ